LHWGPADASVSSSHTVLFDTRGKACLQIVDVYLNDREIHGLEPAGVQVRLLVGYDSMLVYFTPRSRLELEAIQVADLLAPFCLSRTRCTELPERRR
jgi:hypothetical protein